MMTSVMSEGTLGTLVTGIGTAGERVQAKWSRDKRVPVTELIQRRRRECPSQKQWTQSIVSSTTGPRGPGLNQGMCIVLGHMDTILHL